MINLKKLTFSDAKKRIASIDSMTDIEFKELTDHWRRYEVDISNYDPSYVDFRNEIIETVKQALAETNNKYDDYKLDLRVGLKIYELLSPEDGFSTVIASNDDIWRYISVCVMPDITYLRYPDPEKGAIRINRKRFFSHTRRIWLKTLWWYINLGWQGSSDSTYEVLKNNGTNIISHFIERPGKGYRLVLFRNLMKAYSTISKQSDKVFRAAAKLNLAKCKTVEPALTTGGEGEYSRQLFNELSVERREHLYDIGRDSK